MINTSLLLKNSRIAKAVTGMTPQELQNILPAFAQCLIQYRYQVKPKEKRKRALGGGKKGDLPTPLDKLAFVLMYLKVYPTYDVMGFLTGRQRSKCQSSVAHFLPVLEMALGRHMVLPQRKITSPEEFFRLFPEAKEVFLDGTERRVQKPKSLKRRKKLYSGKKKTTTRKTIVMNDGKRRILVLSPTKSGRRHDKRIADKFSLVRNIPPDIPLWADTGFQGAQHMHTNVFMPKKATQNNPLTAQEKENNRIIAGIRIVSEHAIGGMKRLKAASDIYRNRLPNLDDTFMFLSAGIWNFHLQQTQ
jgi:hypothetical protein